MGWNGETDIRCRDASFGAAQADSSQHGGGRMAGASDSWRASDVASGAGGRTDRQRPRTVGRVVERDIAADGSVTARPAALPADFAARAIEMVDLTARVYDTTRPDILGPSHMMPHVMARRAAVRAVKALYPQATLAALGVVFHRNHSTILRLLTTDLVGALPPGWESAMHQPLSPLALAWGVSIEDMISGGQSRRVCRARRMGMKLLAGAPFSLSCREIGAVFRRDESNVRAYLRAPDVQPC